MTTVERTRLFTIGHSAHDLSLFLSLLSRHGINAVADVRSQPYSRFHRQFNRESLAESLKQARIAYVFLGRELGARRIEQESYRNDQARYELIRELPAFREGLARVRNGMARHRLALMCAEKDPVTCHRAILVCRALRHDGIEIAHILKDGSLETTPQLEARLVSLTGVSVPDLFRERRDLIEEAYDRQADRIAYTRT